MVRFNRRFLPVVIGLLSLVLMGTAPVVARAATPATILGAGSGLDAISCPTPTTCYAGGSVESRVNSGDDGVVIATNNGGQTWWNRSDVLGTVVTGISCPTTTTCFTASGGIEATTDGGATWTMQKFTDPSGDGSTDITRIKCDSATTCVATGLDDQQVGVVVWTTDGGATWGSALASTGGNGLSCPSPTLCVSGGSNAYLASANALQIDRSTDGGATWSTAIEYPNPPVAPESDTIESLSCPSPNACLAVGYLGAYNTGSGPNPPITPVLYAGTDNAGTWVSRPLPTAFSASGPGRIDCPRVVDCYTIGLTTAGAPTIEASTNSGWVWHAETVPAGVTEVGDISCPTYFRCYAVGASDDINTAPASILATTDSGQTWSLQTTP